MESEWLSSTLEVGVLEGSTWGNLAGGKRTEGRMETSCETTAIVLARPWRGRARRWTASRCKVSLEGTGPAKALHMGRVGREESSPPSLWFSREEHWG